MRIRLAGPAFVIVATVASALLAPGLCGLTWAASTPGGGETSVRTACGWIGVKVRPMTASIARSLGMAVPFGGIFARPEAGSPAARARIKAGDIITTINGSPLIDARDFADRIATMAPGTSLSLATYRNGRPMRHTLTLRSGKCPDALLVRRNLARM